MILEEGKLCRVKGQGRRVFRITAIYGTRGEFDCIDDNGATRTFLSTLAIPAASTDVPPAHSGFAAPDRPKGRR